MGSTVSHMSDGGGYEAGWYPNPNGGPGLRWYDGTRWTDDYHYDQPPPPYAPQPYAPQPYPPQSHGEQPYGQPYPAAAYPGHGGYPGYGTPADKSPWGYFVQAFTQNYANFEGRARRSEYWWFTLVNAGIALGILFVTAIIAASAEAAVPLILLTFLWLAATIIPSLAVAVRRLHDTNKSGWWLLLQLVPLGGIVILIFLLIEGDPGPNQYGWPPK